VIQLHLPARAADAAGVDRILAAVAVAEAHLALDGGWDGLADLPSCARDWSRGRRSARDLARPLHQRLPPRLPLEEEVERGLDHLLRRRARHGMGEPITGAGQLLQEPDRHGQVEPAKLGGEGLDRRSRRLGPHGGSHFTRMKWSGRGTGLDRREGLSGRPRVGRDGRRLGGCGPCGKQLCCSTFLKGFEPISIKMAKAQGLSLNPSKISGMCGRLMCCLKYEYDPETKAPKKKAGGCANCSISRGPGPVPPASSTTPAS